MNSAVSPINLEQASFEIDGRFHSWLHTETTKELSRAAEDPAADRFADLWSAG